MLYVDFIKCHYLDTFIIFKLLKRTHNIKQYEKVSKQTKIQIAKHTY